MTDTQRLMLLWLSFAVGIAAAFTGCATNSLTVTETTPGGTFTVHQQTTSTWGSRTETGTGSVTYAGDGDDFDFKAGAAVQGQQAAEPVSLGDLLQLLAALRGGITTETKP